VEAKVFFRKLKNFVQKLFEVSKSLLYSKLRCFGIYALPVGFAVETGLVVRPQSAAEMAVHLRQSVL
jgi:hypothetical protein